MSDHIPFEIQSEIMKRLPVKSLIQFRSVSKQWKSFIDSPEFIKNYHTDHTNPQHHLLVSYKLDNVQTYTSIVDNNTFPQQKFPLTAPESLSLLRETLTLDSVNGLLCFYGDIDSKTKMAIIWNPTIRKSVGIVIPVPKAGYKRTIIGFGVCPDSSDPKLVKISVSNKIPRTWDVDVFTLSTRVWKTVYTGAPFKLCDLSWLQSEKFGEVCLPERLVSTCYLDVAKVNKSLGLLEYYFEGETIVCGVWSRKDGANKPFTKIYAIKVEGKSVYDRVLGFRNNGEVLMELDDDKYDETRIEVYEPLSGHISGVGINGNQGTFSARSYMETLLLLDHADVIIH